MIQLEKYQIVCEAHKEVFTPQGLLDSLSESNALSTAALNELSTSFVKRLNLDKTCEEHQISQSQSKHLDAMTDIVSLPWVVNQCLQTNMLAQAT